LCATPTAATVALSLHDALPIWELRARGPARQGRAERGGAGGSGRPRAERLPRGARRGRLAGDRPAPELALGPGVRTRLRRLLRRDRKSTRLNSSHVSISYAVFC